MNYNIHIGAFTGRFNIFDVQEEQMKTVLAAYLEGRGRVTLSGQTYYFGRDVGEFRIFLNESTLTRDRLKIYETEHAKQKLKYGTPYLTGEQLLEFGKEVTDEIVGDNEFGSQREKPIADNENFINTARIETLEALNGKCQYDLSKLISLCKEINDNFVRHNYYSVALLLRTILNHVPPAFGGKESFDHVLAELNGPKHKTKKEILSRLHDLQRKLADLVAHERLQEFEPVLTLQQVSFMPEIDYLLLEIVTELKKKLRGSR